MFTTFFHKRVRFRRGNGHCVCSSSAVRHVVMHWIKYLFEFCELDYVKHHLSDGTSPSCRLLRVNVNLMGGREPGWWTGLQFAFEVFV